MAKDRIDLLQIWMLSELSTEIQSQLVKISDQENRSHNEDLTLVNLLQRGKV